MLNRLRLFELLDGSERFAVTLIVAPAGSGKSLLAASWLARLSGVKQVWVDLDTSADEPMRFWTQVVQAVDEVEPAAGRTALELLGTPRTPIAAVVDAFVASLDGDGARIVVVLDDLHLIADPVTLRSLAYFVERVPDRVRIVATSRTVPSGRFARMRLHGVMAEVDAAQLAFTVEEAAALLASHSNGLIDDREVDDLVRRTEGWAAGIGLAAMSLPGSSDAIEHLRQVSGSHRHIADYLAQEVLDQADPDTARLLLEASMFESMSGPLCDAVFGTTNAAQLLTELARTNLFVIPVDAAGQWYRYHQLFRDALAARRHDDPAAHQRAAQWFLTHNMIEPALRHTAASGDTASLVTILEAPHDHGRHRPRPPSC